MSGNDPNQDPTGLIWMGERYYHPQSASFISPDPIGYPYCLDLYAYANGDPINYHDPDGRFSAPALKTAGTYLIDTVNGPRFQGGMQVFGGVFEMGVGVGMIYGTGGLALPVGAAVTTHGLDHFFTGMRTVFTGEIQSTITSHTLQMTGISRDTAEFLDNGTSFVATLGATAYTQLGKTAATNLPRLASIPTNMVKEELKIRKQIWSSTKTRTSVQNAFRHWKDHKSEFPELQNAKQYVEKAWNLFGKPKEILTKIRLNGEILRYHQETNTFGSFTKKGIPKTMFRPKSGIKYWESQ